MPNPHKSVLPVDPGQLLEQLSDACWLVDADWQIVLVNRAAEQMIGEARRKLLGSNFWTLFPEFGSAEFRSQFEHVMATGIQLPFTQHYTRGGS